MAIKLVTFAAQTVTPQDDALIYEKALQQSGMIYGGTITIKSANVLHVAAGHGALCGRKFTIEATDVPVALTPSGSLLGRIYIHMDLSDTGQPISFMVETGNSLTPVIQQSDVNINNGVYEINLATFDVDTSTISNLVNVAPFIEVAADPEFSKTKTSPVQNKVITKALGDPETIGGAASKAYSKGDLLLAKDGQLYSVTANIAQGGTISNGGNVTSTGSVISQISNFAQLASRVDAKTLGTGVSLGGYTSSNQYTAPSDGYVSITCDSSTTSYTTLWINSAFAISAKGNGYDYDRNGIYIKKGMKLYCTASSGGTHGMNFIPLT